MSRNSAAFILAAVLLGSCASKQPPEIPIIIPDIPVEVPEVSVDRSDYVKSAWALAMINVNRLNTRELVESELSKARKYGLNEIWLEVKPSTGHALWQSEVLPRFESWGEQVVPEGYDYLGTVLEVAKEQGMEVIACVNTLGFACTQTHSGLLYEDPSWEGHTQAKLVDGAVVDIMDLDMPAEDGLCLSLHHRKCRTSWYPILTSFVPTIRTLRACAWTTAAMPEGISASVSLRWSVSAFTAATIRQRFPT